MAEETIYCPSCNNKVRVPEELLGQPVQCPLCHLVFVAPTRAPAGTTPPPAEPPRVQPAPSPFPLPPSPLPAFAPEEDEDAEARAAAALVRGPATALLIVGILGWLLNAALLLLGRTLGPDGVADLVRRWAAMFLPAGDERDRFIAEMTSPETYAKAMTEGLLFLLLCTAVIVGGVQMLQRRTHWLAVLASVLAMVNIHGGCCLLGIPVGIWSLSVLLRPEVRRTFE